MTESEAYNRRAFAGGVLTHGHIAALAEYWQSSHEIDPVDGMIGPATRASIEIASVDFDAGGDGISDGERIALLALELGLREKGEGETRGNNRGERIDYYRDTDGTGRGAGGAGAWCASFQSSSIRRAANELELELGFHTSRGAKKLGDNIGEVGSFIDLPEVGSWLIWHRGLGRQGHIAQCVSYDAATDSCTTLDGNKLDRRGWRSRWAKVGEFEHRDGSWREKLYCISSLARLR